MTQKNTMTLLEYLRKIGADEDIDFLREALRTLAQELIELEVSEQIGAHKHQHSQQRKTYRNGSRNRRWDTRVGSLDLQIPKLRQGSFFPSLLQPRRRSEKALWAVIQQAYIQGVSTRKVDDLVQALGLEGMDKSKVSRVCKQLDGLVEAFRNRALTQDYPYVWLDALYLKVRQNQRIVSMAVVIVIGVRSTGEREVLGFEVGASEEEAFWISFLRSLVQRGLKGVQLVISDAHQGLCNAIASVLGGASWQRCRVHFMRNILAPIPKAQKSMVSALIRTLFAQPNQEAAREQLQVVAHSLNQHYPKAASLLLEAQFDILAYMTFPSEHWRQLHATNPLERLHKEIKRRTNVVGIFPDIASVNRLVGCLLLESDDEWQAATRRYFSLDSMKKLYAENPEELLEADKLTLIPIHS